MTNTKMQDEDTSRPQGHYSTSPPSNQVVALLKLIPTTSVVETNEGTSMTVQGHPSLFRSEVIGTLQDFRLLLEDILSEAAFCDSFPTDVRIKNDVTDAIDAVDMKIIAIETNKQPK